jgi:UDP-N-acetylmuramoyl-L-alanyl-D-glutamate--2,6-diaminopimelate ligase
MRYQKLIQEHPEWSHSGLPDIEITALTADSRQVVPGALFVAIPGDTYDGHDFIPQAAAEGAAVAFGQAPDIQSSVPYVQVDDSRLALAQLAAGWYGFPARKLTMLGVTGTDGKSTTCNLIFEILQAAGIRTGMITTVNAVIGDRTFETGLHVTTPGAMEVQGYLAEMAGAGMTHCILESTSHGLAQHRVSACDFDIAVITNITHEHLDYHGSWEAYQEAKASLFSGLEDSWVKPDLPPKTAVLNRDDDSFELLDRVTQVQKVTYASQHPATVIAEEISSSKEGVRFTAVGPEYRQPIHSHLIGGYNISNCLAAFSAAVEALGVSPADAAGGIERLRAVPGRMEVIDLGQPFTATDE